MSNLYYGWDVRFHPLFAQQYKRLRERFVILSQRLSNDELKVHSDVKLFRVLVELYTKTIPSDPFAQYFVLRGALKKYSRVKKKGLPDRYRLFFKVFKNEKVIVILWLGYPRKEDSKDDCYKVFEKMIFNGTFPNNVNILIQGSEIP